MELSLCLAVLPFAGRLTVPASAQEMLEAAEAMGVPIGVMGQVSMMEELQGLSPDILAQMLGSDLELDR